MGVKQQIVSARSPTELFQISLNHTNTVKTMVDDPKIIQTIDDFNSRMEKVTRSNPSHSNQNYASMSFGNYSLLRQRLLRFFQDKRIKVSLFLQEGIQTSTGALVLPIKGPLPVGTEVPGAIRYFEGEKQTQDSFNYKIFTEVSTDPSTKLGLNMYDCFR